MAMRVREIFRYPVKSLGGQSLARCAVDRRGLQGDRRWAAVTADGGLGSGKNSRRFRRVDGLFSLRARLVDGWADDGGDGEGGAAEPVGDAEPAGSAVPEIGWPDGSWSSVHAHGVEQRLSRHCGVPLRLRPEGASDVPTRDFMDAGRVSLVGTATLQAAAELLGESTPLDPRRFRANLVIETQVPWAEERWVGRRVRVGPVELVGDQRIQRCRMVDIAQVGVPARGDVLRMLGREREVCLAFYADPSGTGTLAVGDPVTVG